MESITSINKINNSKALKSLINDGVYIVENYINKEHIRNIRESAYKCLLKYGSDEYGYGRHFRIDTEESQINNETKMLKSLFVNPNLFSISCDYVGKNNLRFNKFVDITYDFKFCEDTIYGKLHFDRRRQLKYMVYLFDTNKESGSFRFVPKTVFNGHKLFIDEWRKVLSISNVNNDEYVEKVAWKIKDTDPKYKQLNIFRPKYEKYTEYIEASQGTLIIFDTSTLHAGGNIINDNERLNIKSHSLVEVK